MPIERPTILQIIPRLDTGGAELSTIEITEAIVRAGGRALVATDGGRLAERITAAGGELIAFPAATKNPARISLNALALAGLFRREAVSLVHARSRAPAWSALIAARRAKVPFVTTYHGAYAERGHLKRLYNSVMARADRVIANSGYTGALIRSRYGTSPDVIRVIHRGVDFDVYDPARVPVERMQRLRDSWGIGAGERIVLQAARLTSWKGQGVVIEAFARLPVAVRADTVVVLAGDDQGRRGYAAGLRQAIDRNGLGDRIKLVGHCDDMVAALAAASVTVIGSIEPEAFGRVAIEAQAMRSPVIATRLGAPPETVLAEPDVPPERITGWLVPPGDAPALAASLLRALDLSAAERAALGLRAREHAIGHFSLDVMKLKTLEAYDELLNTTLAKRFVRATDARSSGVQLH